MESSGFNANQNIALMAKVPIEKMDSKTGFGWKFTTGNDEEDSNIIPTATVKDSEFYYCVAIYRTDKPGEHKLKFRLEHNGRD